MPTSIALTFSWRIAAKYLASLIGSYQRALLSVLGLVECTISPADIGTACSICLRSLRRQRGSWKELFDGIPTDVKRTLLNNLEEIETAAHVGTLLDTLDQEKNTQPSSTKLFALITHISHSRALR